MRLNDAELAGSGILNHAKPSISVEPSATKPLVEKAYAPNVYPSPKAVVVPSAVGITSPADPFSPRSRAADQYVERKRPSFSVEPSATKPLVEKAYAPNVYPSPKAVVPSAVPSAVSVPLSPIKAAEGLRIHAPSSNDSSDLVPDGVADPDDDDDPNSLTSPIGTKLLHRKVHLQTGFDEGEDGLSEMPNDPNQCSSPMSTELMHRRVAKQRSHLSDVSDALGPQLSSPIGTALMNKKFTRQQRTSSDGPAHSSSHSPSALSATASEASSCSSLASTASPSHGRGRAFSPSMHVQVESGDANDDSYDPNQCSSPMSTELMHRRVARQRSHLSDVSDTLGPQLSSPIGTALMNKKFTRQPHQQQPFDAKLAAQETKDTNDEGRARALQTLLGRSASRTNVTTAGDAPSNLSAQEAPPPAMMGVPAMTEWEAKAAHGSDNALLGCLRCLERNGWKSTY